MIVSEKIGQYLNVDSGKIDGWFYPMDMAACCLLNEVQRSMGLAGSICEVGVWHGKSLVLFSHFLGEGERLLGYDLFPDDLKEKAWANVQKFGDPRSVQLHAGDTSKLTFERLKQELPEGLRLLHIDAGHEYHEVLHQLALFAPFVKDGGCIIMDDYQDREFPGIEAAVLDFAERDRPRRFVPFLAGGNKMYICERGHAGRYQKALLAMDPIKDGSRVTRVRDFTVLVGFSKLAMPAAACLKIIEDLEFPCPYVVDEAAAAERAARFDQLKFGYGVPGA